MYIYAKKSPRDFEIGSKIEMQKLMIKMRIKVEKPMIKAERLMIKAERLNDQGAETDD